MNHERELISNMWKQVPREAFEQAPSSTGLFEQEEIHAIARKIVENVDPSGAEYILLGSATAFREMSALREARKIGGYMQIQTMTAVDVAPQLLQVAERKMQLLKQVGGVKEYHSVLGSIDNYLPEMTNKPGVVFLGVYDADCLLHHGKEANGEQVGLEEYGGGMREILGGHTRIVPLQFDGTVLSEGQPIIQYESPTEYQTARDTLAQFMSDRPDTIGLRVHISHTDFQMTHPLESTTSSLFVSTWFNLANLGAVFNSVGLSAEIVRLKARKGVVMTLRDQKQDVQNKVERCAFLMNNVFGNLAEGEVITRTVGLLQSICTGN